MINNKLIGSIVISTMIIFSACTAFAATGSGGVTNKTNAIYNSGVMIVGNISSVAEATLSLSTTTTTNTGSSNNCVHAKVTEYNHSGIAVNTQYAYKVGVHGASASKSITRHSSITGYRYEHESTRYATTNNAACTNMTPADKYTYIARQNN